MFTSIEDVLYPAKQLQIPDETKSMQVLALGLSRMGTDSLRRALQILGYDHVYHGFDVVHGGAPVGKAWSDLGRRKWGLSNDQTPITREDLDRLIGHCEAVTDQPCACFALELIEAYPAAKVVLNYRDVDSWFQSISNTFVSFMESFGYRYLAYFDSFLYWRKQCFVFYERGLYQGSIHRHARRIHNEHRAMIRGAVPQDRLLEWKVQDGWAPLCEFLQKPIPQEAFPSGNTPEQLRKTAAKGSAAATRRALIRLGITLGAIVAALAVAWRYHTAG